MYSKPVRSLAAVLLLSALATAARGEDSPPVVNVNTATVEELAYLPGIGPTTADNILYAREIGITFKAAEDLEQVHGIGPKTREKLTPYVVFSGKTTARAPIGGSAAKVRTIQRPKEEQPAT